MTLFLVFTFVQYDIVFPFVFVLSEEKMIKWTLILHLVLVHPGILLNPNGTNPPEPTTLIGLVASLPSLPPKQGGKDLSIVWNHSLSWPLVIPRSQSHNAVIIKIKKNQYNCQGKTNGTSGMLHHLKV